MINVEHFQYHHLANFREGDYTYWDSEPFEHARTLTTEDGTVLAVVGVQAKWAGVADVWTIFTEDARGHGLDLIRMIKYFLNVLHEELGYKRLNAWVRDDRPEYHRWAKLCGFVPEAKMPGAGPDNIDVTGYVKWADSLAVAAEVAPQQDQSSFQPRQSSLKRRGSRKKGAKRKKMKGGVRSSARTKTRSEPARL